MAVAAALATAAARTEAITEVVSVLYEQQLITGWRDERYAVVSGFDAPALFHIERAAARFFGTTTYAAHANGYCAGPADCEMWLARRSQSKPIDPGMLDNLVGGGMCAGAPPHETIVREAWEEAGVPAEIASNAMPAGTVELLREAPEGVQSEVIFVYDLELPLDFAPRNMDAEVAEFRRVPVSDALAMFERESEMTLDASLVTLSFLMRRGYIRLEPSALEGVLTLRSTLPAAACE